MAPGVGMVVTCSTRHEKSDSETWRLSGHEWAHPAFPLGGLIRVAFDGSGESSSVLFEEAFVFDR